MREIYASATGCSTLLSVSTNNSHNSQLAMATVECLSTSLIVGSSMEIQLGYSDSHAKVFSGYVKTVEEEETSSGHKYAVVAADVLTRAADFFIVSSNPTAVYTVQNISPEAIIGQLLSMAGITNYTYSSSSYVWGVAGPIEIQLISSYDYSKMLADMISWGFWADENGLVHFDDRRPYVMGGDAVVGTVTTPELLSLGDAKSAEGLRNRVVVWGAPGIYAEASAVSPYLPAGFYKTAIVQAPGIIDSQSMAQQACDFNLAIYNRLTQGYSATVVGNPAFLARKVLHLNKTNENLYIYSADHTWNSSGYICNLELRKE